MCGGLLRFFYFVRWMSSTDRIGKRNAFDRPSAELLMDRLSGPTIFRNEDEPMEAWRMTGAAHG
jgi:hypothetical protein